MRYEVIAASDTTTVKFTDGLGFADHGRFRDMLGSVDRASSDKVVFDFSDLDSIQAAGLGLLLIARERCEALGRHLVLSQPQGGVRRVLEAARLDRLIPIH
jgi:HptB-dependent secretion and biofilm anti anti-sigma factor